MWSSTISLLRTFWPSYQAYDERKKILARDPLACSEGFQTLVLSGTEARLWCSMLPTIVHSAQ